MRLLKMDPTKGYLSADLFLPRMHVHLGSIQAALEFWIEDQSREEGGWMLHQYDVLRDHVRVPRHFIPASEYANLPYPIVDVRPTITGKASFRNKIVLDESKNQVAAAAALTAANHGTFNLSCGRGKTVMAFWKMAQLQQPAIVVVPTTALLRQWEEDVKAFLDFPEGVGRVQGKKFDWKKPVVLTTFQTLSSKAKHWPEEFRRYYGVAFYDEGDLVGAPVFSTAANLFYGQRFSLTATANRADGHDAVYQYHLGRIFYTDLEQNLTPTMYVRHSGVDLPRSDDGSIQVRVMWDLVVAPWDDEHPISSRTEDEIHYGKLCGWLGRHEDRNADILQEVRRARDKGRVVLVLSKSVDHLKTLHEQHSKLEMCGLVIGETPDDSRMEQLRNYPTVFATMQLARRGLNRPRFDTLFLVSPFRSAADYQQASGRILRDDDTKRPPVIVFWEDEIGTCRGAGRELRRLARSFGHNVVELS